METRQSETRKYLDILAKTSLFVFISIFISKLIGYGYKIIIARFYGADVYGLFSLAVIIAGIVTTAASFGLPEGVMRYVSFYKGSKEPAKAARVMKFSLVMGIFLGAAALLVLFFSSELLSFGLLDKPELGKYLKLISFSIPFMIIAAVLLSFIRASGKTKTYTLLANVLQNGFKFVALLAVFFFGFSGEYVSASYSAAVFFLAIVAFFVSSKTFKELLDSKELKKEEEKKTLKELFSYSWPFIFIGLLYSFFYSTDSLVLGYFRGETEVGLYSAAITLATLFFVAPELFMQFFLPFISNKLSQNKEYLIRDISRQLTKWVFAINLPLLVFVFLFPGAVINIFFGSEYLAAENSLRILSVGAIFSGFISLLGGLISMKGYSKLVLYDFLAMSVLNLVLDIILVPEYGMNGAALATVISWIIFIIVLNLQVRKKYNFQPFKIDLIKIAGSAIIPVGVVLLMRIYILPTLINLVIMGLAFMASYAVMLIITRCLDKDDLATLKSVTLSIARKTPGVSRYMQSD